MKSTGAVNTHPRYLFRLTSEWHNIWIYANTARRVINGYKLAGVTYDNCLETPAWHTEPLFLDDSEIEVRFKVLKNEKS